MFKTFKNAWNIPELRNKILFTIFMIIIFRIGATIPVPFIDSNVLKMFFESISQTGNILNYLNMFSGDALSKATLFAMSISPYINASIVMQLLTVGIPALERMAKEGEEGKKKIANITRYVTVVFGIIQGVGFYFLLKAGFPNGENGNISIIMDYGKGYELFIAVLIIVSFSAGTAFIMWIGEQINEKGIGNGISIILFAGIISRMGTFVTQEIGMFTGAFRGEEGISSVPRLSVELLITLVIALIVVAFSVFMTNAERRIPVQYAKRVVGRKMYGGQSTHIPLKVTMSGVLPIIFAGSFTALPATIAAFIPNSKFAEFIQVNFGHTSWAYLLIYFVLIIAFNFFYVAMQFNPIEVANNIKNNGGMIMGFRPGKPTSDYITKILTRITVIGALFLGFIAVLPAIIGAISTKAGMTGLGGLALGGTSVLIVVGVALETVRQIESQVTMRHYKGFLE